MKKIYHRGSISGRTSESITWRLINDCPQCGRETLFETRSNGRGVIHCRTCHHEEEGSALPFGRQTGFTTIMIENALACREEATEFPVLIVTATAGNGDRVAGLIARKAQELGFEVTRDRRRRAIVLNGGASYFFRSLNELDHNKGTAVNWSHIFYDNEPEVHCVRR